VTSSRRWTLCDPRLEQLSWVELDGEALGRPDLMRPVPEAVDVGQIDLHLPPDADDQPRLLGVVLGQGVGVGGHERMFALTGGR
jgi:hypothetical protein